MQLSSSRPGKAILPTCFPPNSDGKQKTMFFSSITGGILMKTHGIFRAGAAGALLGALAGAPGLQAQGSDSPYSYLFKLRAGLTAGDMQKTHFDNKIMGLAAEAKREMPSIGGAVLLELAWEYVSARHHDIYPWDTNPLALNPRYSYDNRKEYGQGINLRLGYSAPMPVFGPSVISNVAQKLEWFAGIGIDRFKVRSEVRYILNFGNPNNGNPAAGQYDGGQFVKEESKLVPGVFAGLKYTLPSEIGFELSLRNFGMWHQDFKPAAYYTQETSELGTGKESTGTSRGWALELAITAKL
jgi:hypothetical protein